MRHWDPCGQHRHGKPPAPHRGQADPSSRRGGWHKGFSWGSLNALSRSDLQGHWETSLFPAALLTESLPSRFGHDVADRALVHQVWQALGSLRQVRGTGGSSFPPAAIPITLEQAHLQNGSNDSFHGELVRRSLLLQCCLCNVE